MVSLTPFSRVHFTDYGTSFLGLHTMHHNPNYNDDDMATMMMTITTMWPLQP
jgi:hypothetical protein